MSQHYIGVKQVFARPEPKLAAAAGKERLPLIGNVASFEVIAAGELPRPRVIR